MYMLGSGMLHAPVSPFINHSFSFKINSNRPTTETQCLASSIISNRGTNRSLILEKINRKPQKRAIIGLFATGNPNISYPEDLKSNGPEGVKIEHEWDEL